MSNLPISDHERRVGLSARYVLFSDQNQVVFNEHWDLTTPGCPIVKFNGLDRDDYVKQVILTPQEFAKAFPT